MRRICLPVALMLAFVTLNANAESPAGDLEEFLTIPDWDARLSELELGFDMQPQPTADASDVLWYYRAGGWVVCTPLVGSDGSVYFGSGDGKFYALDSTGKLSWSYSVGAPIVADPVFDNTSRILFGALNGTFYRLSLAGELQFSFDTGGPIFSSASTDMEGNIYFGSNDFRLYKLSPAGVELGSFETEGWIDSKPTFLPDGRLAVSSYDGNVYFLDQDLTETGRYETTTWLTRALSVADDGTVYAGGMDGTLYAINSAGSLVWQFDTPRAIFSSPLITDTNIFFGNNGGGFYAVRRSSGTESWRFGISSIEVLTGKPTLGPDSKLYFGASDHKLYSLRQDSIRQWTFDTGVKIGTATLTGKPILGGIAITADGTAYFGNCLGVLFAVKAGGRSPDAPLMASVLSAPILGRQVSDSTQLEAPATAWDYSRPLEVTDDGRQTGFGPNAVDMALKTMCMERRNLDRTTEAYNGMGLIGESTLEITDQILDDAFVGPPYAREITDALIYEDDELQDFVLTAAEPLGIDVAPVATEYILSGTPLQTAISDICQDHGRVLTPGEISELATMADRLSLELRQGMALILYAMNDSYALFDEAFLGISPTVESTLRQVLPSTFVMWLTSSYLDQTLRAWKDNLDRDKFARAAATTLSAINAAGAHFAAASDSALDEVLFEFDTPLGFVMVGGASDNTYNSSTNGVRETNALLVDIGGNDHYIGRTCGATDDFTKVAVSIDLAGDDVYDSSKDGAQGWGMLGLGALIDLQGNDLYMSRKHSQGVGVFGVGVLQDVYGNDVFLCHEFSQGASSCGVGVLANEFGDDIYFSPEYAQGFAFAFGSAVLRDLSGDDFYFTGGLDVDFREEEEGKERYVCMGQGFGYGTRRDGDYYSGGGIGILTDGDGDDYYLGDYFAQGSSYWFATGILDDKAGNDVYVARRYSTGAGIHNSVGVLVDEAGNDEYYHWGVGLGHGLDASVGFLVDVMGDDFYTGRGWYTTGHGGDGVGIMLDNAGNDVYTIRDSTSLGYGGPYMENYRRPLGIFIDADGMDCYARQSNDKIWVQDETGVGMDMEGGNTGCLMPVIQ